jgi:hypothetical protein
LKSVEEIRGLHEAQWLTYMKLAGIKTGLLINFNVPRIKDGIKRFVLYPFVLFVSFVVQETDCEQWHAGERSYLAPLMPSVRKGRSSVCR